MKLHKRHLLLLLAVITGFVWGWATFGHLYRYEMAPPCGFKAIDEGITCASSAPERVRYDALDEYRQSAEIVSLCVLVSSISVFLIVSRKYPLSGRARHY